MGRGPETGFARAKLRNPVPLTRFAPLPHGNACYAGYIFVLIAMLWKLKLAFHQCYFILWLELLAVPEGKSKFWEKQTDTGEGNRRHQLGLLVWEHT